MQSRTARRLAKLDWNLPWISQLQRADSLWLTLRLEASTWALRWRPSGRERDRNKV